MPLLYLLLVFIMSGSLLCPATAYAGQGSPMAEPSGVIFAYFQVRDIVEDDATVSAALFDDHIKMLQGEDYAVISLNALLDGLNAQTPDITDNAVVLTFDGGYAATYRHALAKLIDHEMPFMLFIAPDRVGSQQASYLDWNSLQELAAYPFVTIGLLPAGYASLPGLSPEELRKNLNHSIYLFEKNLHFRPEFFSIPYGAYTPENLDVLKEYNFRALLGQQSGVVFKNILDDVLPRFSLSEEYADIDRLKLIARAKPLYIDNVTPESRYLSNSGFLSIGFNVDKSHMKDGRPPSCFGSGYGRLDLQPLGDTRFEIRLDRPIGEGRFRLNCTKPYPVVKPGELSRSRWYGILYTIAGDSGQQEASRIFPE